MASGQIVLFNPGSPVDDRGGHADGTVGDSGRLSSIVKECRAELVGKDCFWGTVGPPTTTLPFPRRVAEQTSEIVFFEDLDSKEFTQVARGEAALVEDSVDGLDRRFHRVDTVLLAVSDRPGCQNICQVGLSYARK